ncbi:MAG: FAD-binding oxidoreductase [Rhodospirillales bacterium]|nr:FAD-binding oxidoreductase [Rhodospirillales bacterium]
MTKSIERPEVTVVGAGIVGICCTLSLLEKGVAVRLVDRAGAAEGASSGNAGVVSPWSCVPQSLPGLWPSIPKWLLDPEGPVSIRWPYLPRVLPWAAKFLRAGRSDRIAAIAEAMDALNRPNVDLYRHHLAGTGHEGLLRDSWYIHAYRDADGADLRDIAWRLRQERGAPIELVDGATLREVEPALSSDYKAAVLIKDQARALAPGRIGKVLAEKAKAMGAEILQEAVRRLVPGDAGSWRVETDHGAFETGKLIVAAGAWSSDLLKPLGVRLPLEPERGYHLVFRNPGVTLSHSVMDVHRKFVVSSMEMGLRSAGTAEFAGLDAAPDYRRARIFERLTKRMLPDLDTRDTEEWMGVRPSFPDSLPCIGEVPGHPNLYAAFGHSHYGFGMAPNTGRIVADLVTGGGTSIDIGPYRVGRFG